MNLAQNNTQAAQKDKDIFETDSGIMNDGYYTIVKGAIEKVRVLVNI